MSTTRRLVIFLLVGFAVFTIVRVIQASFFSDDHGRLFWPTIVLLVLLAVAALWGAQRARRHS